jgi:hypothetical protein
MNRLGVIAREGDDTIAAELFELFKTPWEPCRAGARYRAVLSTTPGAPLPEADLSIVYGPSSDGSGGGTPRKPGRLPVVLVYGKERFPVYGDCSAVGGAGAALIVREDTGEVVGREADGPGGRMVRIGFDLLQEARFLLSEGQPPEHAAVPTLEIHIGILRDLIVRCGLPLVEIPPVPRGFGSIVCLTHDVDFAGIRLHRADRTVLGFLYRASLLSLLRFLKGQLPLAKLLKNLLAIASLPLVYAGLARDFFDQFSRYRQLEGRRKSTFFLVPYKDVDGFGLEGRDTRGRATRYDVDDIRPQISALVAGGWEVGLHAIDAWHDARHAGAERARIHQATGLEPAGVRVHWLFFSRGTPRILEEAGFSYDATWGYNECAGFRAGTAQVFRPPEAQALLELPLLVQDTALFSTDRMNLTQREGTRTIDEILRRTRETGGALTVNWHGRSIGPERFWDAPYRHLLRATDREDVWTATARDVVAWFAARRAAEFVEIDPGRGTVGIAGDADSSVPGLSLRTYNLPAAAGPHGIGGH